MTHTAALRTDTGTEDVIAVLVLHETAEELDARALRLHGRRRA